MMNGGGGVSLDSLARARANSASQAAAAAAAAASPSTEDGTHIRIATPRVPIREAQAPSQLPLPESRLNLTTPRTIVYTPADEIVGIKGVAEEDRTPVGELMFYALTVKCPNGDFAAKGYQRPKWWRVETDSIGYWLLLGGYADLDREDINRVWNWDPQALQSRNIIGIRVQMCRTNDNPQEMELTLVIRYRSEASRRRVLAQTANTTAVSGAEYAPGTDSGASSSSGGGGGARKKRSLVSDAIGWLVHGSSSSV